MQTRNHRLKLALAEISQNTSCSLKLLWFFSNLRFFRDPQKFMEYENKLKRIKNYSLNSLKISFFHRKLTASWSVWDAQKRLLMKEPFLYFCAGRTPCAWENTGFGLVATSSSQRIYVLNSWSKAVLFREAFTSDRVAVGIPKMPLNGNGLQIPHGSQSDKSY